MHHQCGVHPWESTLTPAAAGGATATLTLSMVFLGAYTGAKPIWMSASNGVTSTWASTGTYTVSDQLPSVGTFTMPPSAWNQTFTFHYSDPDGAADFANVQVQINNGFDPYYYCFLVVDSGGRIYLADDTTGATMDSIVAGQAGNAHNRYCSVDSGGSLLTLEGANGWKLDLAMSFTPAYSGPRNVSSIAIDRALLNGGWSGLGAYVVPSTGTTYTISGQVTASGIGMSGASVGLSGTQYAIATTDSNGNYVFNGLPAGGSYTLSVWKSGYTFYPGTAGIANLTANWTAPILMAVMPESISAPATPTGNAAPAIGAVTAYTSGGATSSLGHALEYQFDWGDGTQSAWASGAAASHGWSAAAVRPVTVKARCHDHPTVVSAASAALAVNVVADYQVSLAAVSSVLVIGGTASYLLSVTPSGEFSGTLSLTVSNPSGLLISPSQISMTGTNPLTLPVTVSAPAGAPTTASSVTVSVSGGGFTRTASAPIRVESFDVVVRPAAMNIPAGGSAFVGIDVIGSANFDQPVSFGFYLPPGLPPNASLRGMVFNPAAVTGSGSTSLTLTADIYPWNIGPCTLTARAGDASIQKTIDVSITDQPKQPVISPASVNLPAGQTRGFWASAPVYWSLTSNNPGGDGTLTVSGENSASYTAPSSVTPGATVTLTAEHRSNATLQRSATITLVAGPVGGPDFELQPNTPATVNAGSNASATQGLSSINGFDSEVVFDYQSWPEGISAGFGPNPVIPDGSTSISVGAGDNAYNGTYELPFRATGGGVSHDATVRLTVAGSSRQCYDYALGSPGGISVAAGHSVSFAENTLRCGGSIGGQVSLYADLIPSGLSVSFSPTTVQLGYYATVTVTASANMKSGAWSFRIYTDLTAPSHSVTVNVLVSDASSCSAYCGCTNVSFGIAPSANGDAYAEVKTWDSNVPLWLQQYTRSAISGGRLYFPNGGNVTWSAVSGQPYPNSAWERYPFRLPDRGFGNYVAQVQTNHSGFPAGGCPDRTTNDTFTINLPQPSLTSLSQTSIQQGETADVTIGGMSLMHPNGGDSVTGIEIWTDPPPPAGNGVLAQGITASFVHDQGSPNIRATIQVGAQVEPRNYYVTLTALGIRTNGMLFAVATALPPSPVITFVSPRVLTVSDTPSAGQISVLGNDLDFASALVDGTGLTVSVDQTQSTPNSVVLAYSLSNTAAPGPRSITLSTLGGLAVLTVEVVPTVRIVGGSGVGVGFTADFDVSLSSDSPNEPIIVEISTAAGTGSIAFSDGTSSRTVTSSVTLTITGLEVSSSANNIIIRAKPQRLPTSTIGNIALSAVSVSLALNAANRPPANDNSAAPLYVSSVMPALGAGIARDFASQQLYCAVGTELIGTIAPADYSGMVTLRRKVNSGATFENSRLDTTDQPRDDTSREPLLDSDPQSGQSLGKVYDLDAPGIGVTVAGAVWRVRNNFAAYAVLGSSDVRASSDLVYYTRSSCSPSSSGPSITNDVQGDNEAGLGTTKLTWDLR